MKRRTKYLRNLWTVLAGISAALPVFNESFRFLPLASWSQGGSLAYLSPLVVTLVVTLNCFFVFVRTVAHPEHARRVQTGQSCYSQVGWSLIAALTALGLYLVLHNEIKHDFYYRMLGWDSEDTRRMVGDLVLSICYGLCFVSITRALGFLRLGTLAAGDLDGSD